MKAAKEDKLFAYIREYFLVYLPEQRKVSPNTIRSYQTSVETLLDFIKSENKIELSAVTLTHLTADCILRFFATLTDENGYSIATRNVRMAAIRAFLDYVSDRDVTVIHVLNELKKLPFQKTETAMVVDYLTQEEITAIVEAADVQTDKGFRDRVILVLMYDTGARAQEILNLKLCDLILDRTPKIKLFGKGRKQRVVPLMERTVQYLKRYLLLFHNDNHISSERPLFYSVIRGEMAPLSDRLLRYMIQGYADKARKTCPSIPESVHPHLFRHSRAMHLYQAGMDLTMVSQWLGHNSVQTTLVYAHADTEQKRKAIKAATPDGSPLSGHLNASRYKITDEKTLRQLMGLQ